MPDDAVYVIESLNRKRGNKYLVNWENYPDNEDTWEPRFIHSRLYCEGKLY